MAVEFATFSDGAWLSVELSLVRRTSPLLIEHYSCLLKMSYPSEGKSFAIIPKTMMCSLPPFNGFLPCL